MANRVANISVENARIIFKNFSGEEKRFNPKGKRNFCLVLDEETAQKLSTDGWNVKHLIPKDPDEAPLPYIQVAVAFENYPPNIFMISGGKKTRLDEDSVSALDYAEIENVDLIVRPYEWTTSSGSGIKAYLKNMYVTLVENEFEKKYRDLEESDDDLPF